MAKDMVELLGNALSGLKQCIIVWRRWEISSSFETFTSLTFKKGIYYSRE
jgi:hypothetical protein